jgi:hypothetical protein
MTMAEAEANAPADFHAHHPRFSSTASACKDS